ncbi:rhodanese-like domain-containing protein [Polynucleobacter sphagniphilus]|jgi:rhodanese-related sulfurtransferase|uniref:Rhodanese-related sulfurtransferase n=1 Tax=Polynucleobacter sphagniphilus TaxID=1743169 RepID=A0AA43M6L7_9BURK|nr:rhodanese-like domain-containing protein [Polynucleobacter sphagniphilus]MDF9789192.1 rhodanese-related sulfurtransferase [Polynucleobacter sphagniphilus]MDH6422016.1 rhodanese-related sulfurtransferase [Polynucleobacter sphagniphilus]MDH6503098.1 rhodanese-related sulfurtransferase [Polynucleobacter sphagniphilus]MDH6511759.1 rhodanese-related sulfurtransferase [Polynucleobacter sphagniphilus]OLY95552.1 sulfurtransferase [Polynucleobacter sphagniphilus]
MKTAHDLVAAAKAAINEVSLVDAPVAIQNSDVLLDVREADEYVNGHIPGAIHISRGLLEFRLSNDPELSARSLKIVLYCKNSGRAALASKALHEMGYLHVQSIAGGFDAWAEAGNPVAKPEPIKFE